MSLIQLNSKEKIRNYEENLKTKGSVEDMKSIRFLSENEVVIPGKFKCQYACIGDMRNALMSLSMSKEASSLLHFAEKVIVGDVDGNKGRTYFQEMERTMKAVKTEIGIERAMKKTNRIFFRKNQSTRIASNPPINARLMI